MPNTIDERVVEMRFDNAQFEKNVSTSMSTIQKLENALLFKGMTQGFKNVNDAAKGVNLTPVSDAVDTIKMKFSALEIMGITALTNLTNSAVNLGKKMASALTIDPVKTGFQEYETQINATQTIMANTQKEGATITDVNAALDELNHYADLTIYNFTEMTKNIGTFTAAGVNLKTSVSAIQGIANLAAVSGSTSQQASTAMYQLSQALASGTVKLMDWNSVVNAGMGGQVFQDALKDTARIHGVAIDQMIEKEGSFRETLSNGWLTSEILTETLGKFTTSGVNEYLAEYTNYSLESIEAMRKQAVASEDQEAAFREMAATLASGSDITEDEVYQLLNMSQTAEDAATKVKTLSQLWDVLKEAAQSGWSQTWRTVMGDFEETKETLTAVSDVLTGIINASSQARNDILDKWKDFGGRTYLFDGLRNAFLALESVIKPVKEAFNDIFPATSGYQLAELSKSFRDFTATLILTEDRSKTIKTVFTNVFKVIKVGTTVVKQLWKVFAAMAKVVVTTVNSLLDLVGVFDEGTNSVSAFESTLDTIIGVIEAFGSMISDVITVIGELIPEIDLLEVKTRIIETVTPLFSKFAEILKTVATVAGTAVIAIAAIAGTGIVSAVSFLYTKITGIVEVLRGVGTCAENLEKKFGKVGAFLIYTFDEIQARVKSLKDKIIELIKGDSGQTLMENLADAFEKFKNKFVSFVDTVGAKIKEFGIARALLIFYLGTVLYVMVSVSKSIRTVSTAISTALGGVGGMFTSLTNAIKSVTAVSKAPMILKIATAIAILAGSLALLSMCDQEKLKQSAKTLLIVAGAVAAVSAVMAALPIAFEKLITGFDAVKLTSLGTAMIAMAGSIGIMVLALKGMEHIDTNEIDVRIGALATIMMGLAGFAVILSKWAPKFSMTSLTLISFAYGIKSFVSVLSGLTNEQFGTIKKNIKTIGQIMALISLVMVGIGNIRLGSGVGILLAAASIKIICSALNELKISLEGFTLDSAAAISTGLVFVSASLAVILTALTFFLHNSGINKTILSAGASMMMMAVGFSVITAALTKLVEALQSVDNLDKIEAFEVDIIILFGAFAYIAHRAKDVAKDIGISFAAFGVGVLAIAEAMNIMKTVFEGINNITLIAIIGGLSAITIMFSYVTEASKQAGRAYKSILAMIAAMTAIVTISALLTFLDNATLAKMGAVALGISGVMYTLMLGLNKLSSLKGKSPSAAILSVAGLIAVIVGSLKVLSTIDDMGMLATSVAGLTVIMATIGVTLYTLGQMKVENSTSTLKVLLGACLMLGGIALSLSSVADSFIKLSTVNWDASGKAIIAAIGMLGVLTIGLLTMANYTDSAGKSSAMMIALAGSLLIMAAAVSVVCNALTAIQNVDWKSIAVIGGVMAGLMMVVGVLGKISSSSPLVAAGIALVVAAMYGLAKAIEVIAPAMGPISEAFTVMTNAVGKLATVLITAWGNTITILSVAFSTILNAVGELVTTIIDAINSITITIANAVIAFSLAAINFGTAFSIIVNAIMQLSTISLVQGATIAANIVMIGAALALAFNFVTAGTIVASIGLIVAAISVLFAALINGIEPAMSSLSTIGTKISTNISEGLSSSTKIVISAGNKLMVDLLRNLKVKATNARSIGMWVGTSLAGGINQGNQTAYNAGTILGAFAEEGIRNKLGIHSFSTILAGIGKWVGPSIASGMLDNKGDVFSAGAEIGQAGLDGIDSKTDLFAAIGESQGEAYGTSLFSKVQSAWSSVVSVFNEKFRELTGKTKLASGAKNDVKTNKEVSAEWLALDSETREAYGSYENFYNEVKNHKELLKKQTKDIKEDAEETADVFADMEDFGDVSGAGSSGSGSSAAAAAEEVKFAVKEAAEEIVDYADYFNVFSYAGDMVDAFHKQYKDTLDTVGDIDPIQTSKNAIQLFALNLYKNSGMMQTANAEYQKSVEEVLTTEMTATERSQKLADLKAEHIKQRTQEIQQVYEEYTQTIKDGIQNDIDMLSKFEDSSEETMDDYLENMQSQVDALNTWEYKMRELAKKDGMTNEIYDYLINKGFNDQHLVNELFEASEDQWQDFIGYFNRLEGGSLSDLVSNSLAASSAAISTGFAQATEENAIQLVQSMNTALSNALNEVNPDEDLGTKLGDSMISGFKDGIEVIIDDTESLKNSMSAVGTSISEGVTIGIRDGQPYVISAVNDLGNATKEAFAASVDAHSPSRDFIEEATKCIEGLVVGFQGGIEQIRAVMTEVGTAAKEAFALVMTSENWLPSGGALVGYMTEGITKDFVNLKNSLTEAIDKTRIEIEQMMHSRFYEIGQHIVQGLIDGLLSKLEELEEAAEALAEAMESEVEEDLDINSPSKVFMRLGQYTGEGFVNGLKSYIGTAASTAKMLSEETITTVTDGLNAIANLAADEMDEPVITPVLDFSQIQNGSKMIGSMLNTRTGINLSRLNANTQAAANDLKSNVRNASSGQQASQAPTYTFTQNNYSPKALSRIDIYRQTKNQFSALKGLA